MDFARKHRRKLVLLFAFVNSLFPDLLYDVLVHVMNATGFLILLFFILEEDKCECRKKTDG